MVHVKQTNHETCQQACIAMLAGVVIKSVIERVGDRALDLTTRRQAFEHFGITYPESERGFLINAAERNLVQLVKEHRTLWCTVADWKDESYGHAVLVYDGHLYDPWRGIDPSWPWSRHIWKAMPVEGPATRLPAP
jgi:hypothetical protein